MRWKIEYPNIGSERTVSKFLLFPKRLWSREKECDEIRWLERCEIVQEYRLFNEWKERYWAD
jgi:hypothetical protein